MKLPMVDAVIEYLFEETSERPSHGVPIVVGTMATYMQYTGLPASKFLRWLMMVSIAMAVLPI